MKENEVTIPEEVQNVCRALAKAARENGLRSFSGRFTPPFKVWAAEVSFKWEEGRHGEDTNNIEIYSNFTLHKKINEVQGH